MKITTDACVFGAWAAARLGDASHILDIGSGTGLLTLMLAQKKKADPTAVFQAIELDVPSYEEAQTNFATSPWPEKIRLHAGDIRQFAFSGLFDFVIVNPPFYESQLASPHAAINNARHDSSLVLSELVKILKRVLAPGGKFAILLPASREDYFSALARETGFGLAETCRLRQTPDHEPFRSLLLFQASGSDKADNSSDARSSTTEIIIRDEKGNETQRLLEVMEEYYIR